MSRTRVQLSDSTIIGSNNRRNRGSVSERGTIMTEATPVQGGFATDPTTALTVTGGGGCCGSAAVATTSEPQAASPSPCCGSSAEATAEGSCCGNTAKTEAVAAGQGCCG
jgi:hypothetical protein